MATEITLCIEDDGSMTIKTGEKQENPEQEQAEGGNKQPVKSLDEALTTIKQLAASASMPMDDQEGQGEDQAAGEEDDAMNQAYRPGVRG